MDKRALLGIACSLTISIVILSFIIYGNSDFDEQLIHQVDEGVPAEKLIPQIDEETQKLQTDAKRRLLSIVMDKKYWGNGDLASPDDFQYYTTGYVTEMDVISNYDSARKKFARREITKKQFLQEIEGPKTFFKYALGQF